MRVGVPTEIKDSETRVALTPQGAAALVRGGHTVVVQTGAGAASSFADDAYLHAGASLGSAADAWAAELVLKVKEPLESEYGLLSANTLFTFLHLAANPPLAKALCAAGTLGISYDTVQLADGSLPLLTPMSEVAGRLSVLAGAHHLQTSHSGRGVLLAGVPGVPGADVVVLGGGIAGSNAVAQAVALGAHVTVLDISVPQLRTLDTRFGGRIRTVVSTPETVAEAVAQADLVIGAVLVPGNKAPVVVTHQMVLGMRPGSVLVDIAIDQGGCFEDSRPTTHSNPVYTVGKSLMYCVANMPGAVGMTSTRALTNATLPYVVRLADGVESAIAADAALGLGVNTQAGEVVHPTVRAVLAGF
jgi:alanine dehydrogenase